MVPKGPCSNVPIWCGRCDKWLLALGFWDASQKHVKWSDSSVQANPDITISKIMAITPIRDADFRRRYAEGLRRAGLPE